MPLSCGAVGESYGFDACMILIIDDDVVMSAYIEELLARCGYEYKSFDNGEKGLGFLAWNTRRVGLIISDVVMPGLDGYEVAREAAKLKPGIPVILISGYGETLPEGAGLANVRAVLEKPLVKTDLLQAVEGVLQECSRNTECQSE